MEHILKMIEEVSPDDTAKLDEIDARVCCYIENRSFDKFDYAKSAPLEGRHLVFWADGKRTHSFMLYTRSRDAIKTIRPNSLGWCKTTYNKMHGNALSDYSCYDIPLSSSPVLPTEELAELHAILQAIAYERENAR